MLKLTGLVAVSLCSLALTGSSLWAGDSQPRVTADWQDGFAPDYSNYGPGGGPSGNGPYDQWTPNSNSQYGPNFSTYGGPANGGQFQNSPGPFAPGQGPRRHGCHHGRCYSSPFNNYGGSPTTAPNYGDPNWAAPYYGPANGAPYGSGVSQPFGQGVSPNQSQFFGQSRSFSPQSPGSSFGPSTNFPPPPLPNRGFQGQGQNYSNQNYIDPYSSLNQPLNSYNQQPNSFGPSSNSFGAPPQSFGQPGYNQPSYNQPSYNQPSYNQQNAGYGQTGPSFGQPRSSYGQQAPMFSQPQSSPFYP
jgi:hypothetical protein